MAITVEQFIERWQGQNIREQQGYTSHFNDICELIGHPKPTDLRDSGFAFEQHLETAGGGRGRADVWKKGFFAWEYKGPGKDLDAAYAQVFGYRGDLNNPPLLVVSDYENFRIYPQGDNMSGEPFKFTIGDLKTGDALKYLYWLFTRPEEFRAEREREIKANETLTQARVTQFARIADAMRSVEQNGERLWTNMQIARFLAKLVFCMFAEDVGLLPNIEGKPILNSIISAAVKEPTYFIDNLSRLFRLMADKGGRYGVGLATQVYYFNGGLFEDSTPGMNDGTEVLNIFHPQLWHTLKPVPDDVLDACNRDWSKVNPTIFGTLFERALDENKRSQLGAHYTSESDIRLIVDPVMMQPLYRQWGEIEKETADSIKIFTENATGRAHAIARDKLIQLHNRIRDTLKSYTVLDPACGSGNFLYVGLKALKDLEARVKQVFKPLELDFEDWVTPRQFYGIETDPFAAKLAQIVVWIGYLQWRYQDSQPLPLTAVEKPKRPNELALPILKDKDNLSDESEPDRIVNDDAILRYRDGQPYEPEWPRADVIIGNPPFLGGSRLRSQLGDKYLDDLWSLYAGKLPGFSDLVCYWFEKARANIDSGKAGRAGLLATNSIRGGANRTVLDRIKQSGDIFYAWSDREWSLDGAAVRVSMVGFDKGVETEKSLNDGLAVAINADLTGSVDIAKAKPLAENLNISFKGPSATGKFDIPESVARKMLDSRNADPAILNSDVIRPVVNADDITKRSRQYWTIDFGVHTPKEQAQRYEAPFAHLLEHVYPVRMTNNRKSYRDKWWLYGEPRVALRNAMKGLRRYLITPHTSKHRVFTWVAPKVLANNALVVFARDDDYFFGVLHSYLHECWSLRMGTWLGAGNDPRYTSTTAFETFPMPFTPGSEPQSDYRYQAVEAAAAQLHAEREGWLNPVGGEIANLKERTLTNLYNEVERYREVRLAYSPSDKKQDALYKKIVPRIAELHAALDTCVLACYGWDTDLSADQIRTPEGEEEVLRRLLKLNLERGGVGVPN